MIFEIAVFLMVAAIISGFSQKRPTRAALTDETPLESWRKYQGLPPRDDR